MSDVLERKVLEPDPGMIKSLGAHHTLESAVADLIDNSVDAGADRVLVRFDTEGGHPVGLHVADNGRGMDGRQADEAMRLGRQRNYGTAEQGHFGIGLKAASFSHADTITVCTTPAAAERHGRRLRRGDVERDYGCDVLDPASIRPDALLARVGGATGTVVSWSDTHFPRAGGTGLGNWLDDARTRLGQHLGLTYHRLIESGRVRIEIEVFDRERDRAGIPEPVAAIDPLGFAASAVPGYPRTLVAQLGADRVGLGCHIVPPRSSGPNYRLYGRDGADFQGFFIYRHDRLLQAGGWNQVVTADRTRALARVVIDDYPALAGHVRLNPEKKGIVFSHDLQGAIARAASFPEYLAAAETVFTESRKRQHKRRPVAEPSKGLHEEVRRVIRAEIPLRAEEGPVEIRWDALPAGRFFELDREGRTIYLNKRYRPMLTGGATGLSDAPLVKTLLFLLTEDHFKGQQWGPRDKDLLEVWDAVLAAAVRAEHAYREGNRR
ncbi:ATP-binding protein [Actinoplanes sp. CA-030573]|uniref:ATP-binding protein n=1 Tax=Actinoplanes sp. CA-030573 TaxID=3239898 RepID=UPI003D8A9624